MTEEHGHELGPGTETLCVTLGAVFYDQFLKIDT
jgi:hypothetical protein